jgi:hypothetical protein
MDWRSSDNKLSPLSKERPAMSGKSRGFPEEARYMDNTNRLKMQAISGIL